MNSTKELLECAKLLKHLARAVMHEYGDLPKITGKTDREHTVNLLHSIEWSMGNGQCFFCYGSQPRAGWWTREVGHENDCGFAHLLESLGEKPTWIRENNSKARIEMDRRSKMFASEMLKEREKDINK